MRRDPRRAGWLVAAASVAAVGAFMLGGFYFWQNDRPHFSLWVDVFWTIAAPVTAIRALLTARRQSAAQLRFAWNCFAAGCTCFALGMLVWDWFEPVEGRFRPFPTIADLGYLLVSLWYMAGFVAFRPSAPSRRVTVRQLYYLGILICSAGMVNTLIFAAPMSQSGFGLLQIGVAILYPALAVTALAFGLTTLWVDDRAPRMALWVLVFGAAIDFIARITYRFQLLSPTKIPSYVTSPLWVVLLACTFWAAWAEGQEQVEPVPLRPGFRLRERPRAFELTIPALAMLAVVVAGLPRLRVQFISGYSPDDVVRRQDRPGYGFMQKPFTPEALRRKVREMLNGPPAEAHARSSAEHPVVKD